MFTSSKELTKKEKVMMGIVGVMFLLMIIYVASTGDNKELTSTTVPTNQYITQTDTPERKIEEKFIQVLSEKTNMGEKKVKNITISPTPDEPEGQNIAIEFVADQNLTNDMTRKGIWIDAIKIFKAIIPESESEINKITLKPYLTLTDQNGNESIDNVMIIGLKRKTWEKINWDNFLYDNLPNVIDNYWEHPALSK